MKKILKNKKLMALFLAMVMVIATASIAFCEPTGTADATVTAAFTDLKLDIVATLGVIAGLGVTVMGIFLAWKYGRKIFNQVAK